MRPYDQRKCLNATDAALRTASASSATLQIPARPAPGNDLHRRDHRRWLVRRQQRGHRKIGPAVLLSYLIAGIVVFAVIWLLARMAMDQPGLGSFTEYVRESLGSGAGFITGWLYWWFWVVVVAFEALVGAQTAHAWLPMFEIWQIGLGLMAILTAVNLASARSYGEFEFWFASIKVAAIVVFIVVAAAWLWGQAILESRPRKPHAHSGFAPFGWAAVSAAPPRSSSRWWAPRS
jgi:AAT family amino acid transporter/GABA permease